MHNTACPVTISEGLARAALLEALGHLRLNEVARILDLPRSTVASFMLGASRAGTSLLVASRVTERADRLNAAPLQATGT